MPSTLDNLKSQAQTLSQAEQVELASFLLNEVGSPLEVDPDWRAEIAQRVAEIRSGEVVGRSVDEVLNELRGRQ